MFKCTHGKYGYRNTALISAAATGFGGLKSAAEIQGFNFRGSCSSAQLSVKTDKPIGRHPRENHPHVKFVPELQSKKLASQTKKPEAQPQS